MSVLGDGSYDTAVFFFICLIVCLCACEELTLQCSTGYFLIFNSSLYRIASSKSTSTAREVFHTSCKTSVMADTNSVWLPLLPLLLLLISLTEGVLATLQSRPALAPTRRIQSLGLSCCLCCLRGTGSSCSCVGFIVTATLVGDDDEVEYGRDIAECNETKAESISWMQHQWIMKTIRTKA